MACLAWIGMNGQAPERVTSADIHDAIKKLGIVGSALYVAAHPDDENTRMISYFANEVKVNSTYLSMTRGDGGQNLVGPELREYLGLIRTQELLMARSVDGGRQMFTRANDFGYSKTPEETLDFWNKDEVLADVVWAIRKAQPDVIVNRFPHEHLNGNHGHHTTSAMLSYEAFELAGDPNAYPEQLKYVDVWQPRRLFFNTFWWFYGSREAFDKADKSRMVEVDVGVYYPMHAISNPEIAALSRSMHKSQGFGSAGSRASQIEYLDLLKGDMPENRMDAFDGIDISWSRIGDDGTIQAMIENVASDFDHEKPYTSIAALQKVRELAMKLPKSSWKERKLNEIDAIILDCTGLYTDARASDFWGTPGDSIGLNIEATNRSTAQVILKSVTYNGQAILNEAVKCEANSPQIIDTRIAIAKDATLTTPYWLTGEGTEGMYAVEDQLMRGIPENKRDQGVYFSFEVDGQEVNLFRPFVYRRTDPVEGEVYRPFEIVPEVMVNFSEAIQIYAGDASRDIQVRVKSAADAVNGTLSIDTKNGWAVEPASYPFELESKGDEAVFTFALTPPANQSVDHIEAVASVNGSEYRHALVELDYDHIPTQTILEPARVKVVKVDLQRAGNRIGYVMGAGDQVPESLEQVGYTVELLDEEQIDLDLLKQYDAIILGIRVYNVSDRIRHYKQDLFDYVKEGGTLITQYNTSRRLNVEVAPLPLTLSRDRVTDETAEVKIIAPDHPALNYPNKIGQADFEGWVQERGLYFPNEWDDGYTPLLSMHDKGEEPKKGSILVAEYGEGYFVYTGISWFRELPAGVPGAFRLLTNLISLGNSSKS